MNITGHFSSPTLTVQHPTGKVNQVDNVNYIYEIIKYFKLKNTKQYEWIQVCCPYHNDSTPSAGLNIKKQWFNCFLCGGKSFKQIYEELINEGRNERMFNIPNGSNNILFNSNISQKINGNQMANDQFLIALGEAVSQNQDKSFRIKREITDEEVYKYLLDTINEKGINPELLQKINAEPILDKSNQLYGYIKFQGDNGFYVARKFLPDDVLAGERYLNASGEKPFYGEIKDDVPEYIVVEGIMDYLTLLQLGYENVVCNLGTATTDRRCYKFKGKTVFILFDADYAGYDGAQKWYTSLRKIKAYPIILDLPSKMGKDINEAYVKDKDATIKWLKEQLDTLESTDKSYVNDFEKEESLYSLRTGLSFLDDEVLGGGFKEGTFGIAGKPGTGKTAIALYIAQQIVQINKRRNSDKPIRALYCTYEIPKAQCWARISSIYDNQHSWTEIERDRKMDNIAKSITAKIADNLRIVDDWGISEIARAIDYYDIFFIDYIQVMPGDSADERTRVARNIRAISQLRQEYHKIFIVLSSIPRVAYEREDLSVFKESGDIEFAIQGGFLLKDINQGGEDRLLNIIVLKNTRGPVGGSFWLKGNMLHNYFKESQPDLFNGEK